MKRIATGLVLGAALLWNAPSRAEIGTLDQVPASTLLLPYFEVDLANANGATTLLSIMNASASATMAHVTLWTDRSVPTFSFDVYLTGYDVESIDLRDIFSGVLPQTATNGQDPRDDISPQGPVSQDINFATCNRDELDPNDPNSPPDPSDTAYLPHDPLSAGQVTALRNAHTGKASAQFGGQCAGTDFADSRARGYVTVDVANQCAGDDVFPSTAGYFVNGGGGVAGNRNILWGDTMFLNPATGTAQAEPLVHIEADSLDPRTSTAGNYTFYGRYVATAATDNREPLATTWGSDYTNGRTDLIVWRDTGKPGVAFPCGTPQTALGQTQVVAFDWEEDPVLLPSTFKPFPAEANRVTVGTSAQLPFPAKNGWIYLNLNASTGGSFDPVKQSYVAAVNRVDPGVYSSEFGAVAMDNASDPTTQTIACGDLFLQFGGFAAIDPGTTDIGNHGDDVVTNITLPFTAALYDSTFTTARVSSNGNLQFVGSNASASDVCLPTAGFDHTVFAFWDDLTTSTAGDGVFTSTTGTAPNRFFNVEWRAHVKSSGKPVNFEIRIPENLFDHIEVVFGQNVTPDVSSTMTIGVQKDSVSGSNLRCNSAPFGVAGIRFVLSNC